MSILDPKFRYVPSDQTDLRKTFARLRRELAEKQKREAEAQRVVAPIKRAAK